jgi:hypothetical protein
MSDERDGERVRKWEGEKVGKDEAGDKETRGRGDAGSGREGEWVRGRWSDGASERLSGGLRVGG